MAAHWTTCQLIVRVWSDHWEEYALDQPFAIVGNHKRCDIPLAEGPQKNLLIHASDYGIYALPLFAGGMSEGWLKPDQPIDIEGGRIQVSLSGPPSAQQWPTTWQRQVEFFHHGKSKGQRKTNASLRLVGRRRPSHWRMEHQRISSCHCAVYFQDDRAWAIDLLSRGGVTVDGCRVRVAELSVGQRIELDKHIQMQWVSVENGDSRVALPGESTDRQPADDIPSPLGPPNAQDDSPEQIWEILSDREEAIRQHQDELRALNASLQQLARDLAHSEASAELAEKECERLRKREQELAGNLEAANQRIAALDAQLQTLKDQPDTSELQREALVAQTKDLEARCDHWKSLAESQTQSLADRDARIAAEEQSLKTARSELEAALNQLRETQAQLREAQAERDAAASQLEQIDQRQHEQREQAQSLASDVGRMQTLLEESKLEIVAAEQRLADADDQLEQQRQATLAAEEELRELQAELDGARAAEQKMKAERDAMQLELSTVQEGHAGHDQKIAELTEQLATSETALAGLTDQNSEYQLEVDHLNAEGERLKEDLREASRLQKELREEFEKQLEKTIDGHRQEVAESSANLETTHARVGELEGELQAIARVRDQLQAALEAADTRAATLQQQSESLARERDQWHETADSVTAELEETRQTLQSTEQALVEAKHAQEDAERSAEKNAEKTREHGANTERISHELSAAMGKLETAERTVASLQTANEQLQSELAQHRDALSATDLQRNSEFQTLIDDAEQRAALAEHRCNELSAERDRLLAKLEQTSEESATTSSGDDTPPPPPVAQAHVRLHELESAQMLADALTAANEQLRLEQSQLRSQIQQLEQQVAAASEVHSQELKAREQEIQEAKQHLELFRADWEFTLERKEAALKQLQQHLDEAKAELASLQAASTPIDASTSTVVPDGTTQANSTQAAAVQKQDRDEHAREVPDELRDFEFALEAVAVEPVSEDWDPDPHDTLAENLDKPADDEIIGPDATGDDGSEHQVGDTSATVDELEAEQSNATRTNRRTWWTKWMMMLVLAMGGMLVFVYQWVSP